MTEDTGRGPLQGVRVLELGTTIAGPFCARLLADFGAEVIKLESPEGDPIRNAYQSFRGKNLYAASLMRNKRLLVVDLRRPEGQALVRRFVAKCDVVVENFRPGTLEKWGLGYEDLATINPGLVLVRVSGYGQTGPYSPRPGYGIICEAVAGLRHVIGDPDRPPARANLALTDMISGIYAAFGTMMALRDRDRSGKGQVVDMALYEGAFSFMEAHVPAYEKLGYVANREGAGHSASVVNNLFPTRDGVYVHVQGSQANAFRRLCAAMQRPDLLDDERYNTARARQENHAQIDAIVAQWMAARDYAAIEAAFSANDVTFTRIYTMADVFRDPHFAARGMLAQVPDEELGTLTVPAPVPRLTRTPGVIRHAGGRAGRDTRDVLRGLLGMTDDEVDSLERAGVVSEAQAQAGNRSER
jgi:crotonobetainyl-CoA:carnitine CoA-transferase CaiB-like acyl-CoA transferase